MNIRSTSFPETVQSSDRPWVHQYASGMPSELNPDVRSSLEAFDRCLATKPDACAVWYFDSPLTYRDLDNQATRLAHLWHAVIKRGDRVAILNQNTPATVIALVAAWRLGATVMPLNPMLTRWELVHYLRDGEPRAAVVGICQAGAFKEAVEEWGGEIAVVLAHLFDHLAPGDRPALLEAFKPNFDAPADWLTFASLPDPRGSLPMVELSASDTALLTYTSGTTGRPKAALNTHGNVSFSAEVYRRWLQLGEDDILFAAAPFSHITGLVAHIAAAFAAGLPLVTCYRFDAGTVLSLLHRHGCTTTVAAITAYISLLDHPQFDPKLLGAFRKLFSGGAPVSAAVVARWEAATGVYIHNAYGLTETTSPTHLVPYGSRAPVDADSDALSVGVPVPGTDCQIVDPETLQPLPSIDDIGEILIRGPQVVSGYWRNSEETDAAFRNGWLRTGDLGRSNKSGWFFVVDRAKDVIVASGFKVWPREVELVLEAHPAIREAAVVGVPDSYRGQAPKAFIVLRAGLTTTSENVLSFCRERLAPYKLPRLMEFVAELPRNHSGKLLRRELREKSI